MRILFSILFFFFVDDSIAQTWVNHSKGVIRFGMEKYLKKNNYTASTITEDKESLTVSLRETMVQPATFYYHFSDNNKCNWMKISSNCDSCLRKEVNTVLGKKNAGWKSLGKGLWVSKRSKKLQLEIVSKEDAWYYTVHKKAWTKEEYSKLLSGN